MKKYMMFLPIVALMIIGCDSRDSNQKVVPQTKPVIITYDLSEYIVPELNQSNFYRENEFEKLEQEARYKDTNGPIYKDKTYSHIDNRVELKIDGLHEYDYIMNIDDIKVVDMLVANEVIIKKVVAVDDTLRDDTTNEVVDGLNKQTNYSCKIAQHKDSMIIDDNPNVVYTDILHEKCIKLYDSIGDIDTLHVIINGTITENYYYSKGVGLISSDIEEEKSIKIGSFPTSYTYTMVESVLIYKKPF